MRSRYPDANPRVWRYQAIRRIIDRPANRTTFHVGPCPELDHTGAQCLGEIRAYIPAEDHKPATLECDSCGVSWDTGSGRFDERTEPARAQPLFLARKTLLQPCL